MEVMEKMKNSVEIRVMRIEEFSRKFKDFQQIFGREETLIARNDIGLWILAILPADNDDVQEGVLFYEEATPTSDPRRFAYVREGRLILGECDYYIDGEELVKHLEDTMVLYEEVEEDVREFTERQRWWCISCSSYVRAEPTLSLEVREKGEKVITIKLYCSYCGAYLDSYTGTSN